MRLATLASRAAGILITIASLAAAPASAQAVLTLAEAERLALEQTPRLQQWRQIAEAAAERTRHEGQLPDPQLTLGLINVPTDTFRLNQDDMTMSTVGIRQAFPPGDTLALRTQRAEQEYQRDRERLEIERRGVVKQVRAIWLDIYYAEHGLRLLEATRELARRDLESVEARYRAAQEMQRTVFRARQALARIDERLPSFRAAAAQGRARLERWIGSAARAPLPDAPPLLPPFPERFDPKRHPEWLATQAEFDMRRMDVGLARAEYKPGWMLDLSYGFRRPMPNGTDRADMLSAMVTFDLPIFRAKRQDRRLAERQAQEAASRYETEDKQRELEATYAAMRAEYDAVESRIRVYEHELLPALRRETQVTLSGFAREQAERREVRMKQIDAELELLRLRVDRAKVQSELLYLTGEQP